MLRRKNHKNTLLPELVYFAQISKIYKMIKTRGNSYS